VAKVSLAPEPSPTLEVAQNLLRKLTTSNYRRFSGDESFLRDPNAFNDAKNTATLEVIDEPISEVGEKAEDKSRL
jgi:hypothetical protein